MKWALPFTVSDSNPETSAFATAFLPASLLAAQPKTNMAPSAAAANFLVELEKPMFPPRHLRIQGVLKRTELSANGSLFPKIFSIIAGHALYSDLAGRWFGLYLHSMLTRFSPPRFGGRYISVSGTILMLATALPLLRVHNRWIRMLDFPRMQLAAWCAFNMAWIGLQSHPSRRRWGWFFLHGAALAYHAKMLAPFTRVKSPESESSSDKADPLDTFSMVVANVLMTNRNVSGLISMIGREKPDLVLLNEPDSWWEERLRDLEKDYRWRIKAPQSDTYGMIFYSRLPLTDFRIDRRVHADVPSIRAEVELPSGKTFRIYCVHPKPPAEENTEDRDAELYLVGKELRESGLPGVVGGDLNDVAWSRTTRLFQKVSRTLDPRIGRGFFNTFHARQPLLRYSLDHVFHTREFSLSELRRLEKFGSDHFPILVRLSLDPKASLVQTPPCLDSEDNIQVKDTMEKAGVRP